MRKGLFITFEGSEGAGKSTQAEMLANRMREAGYTVVVTREPGGTRIGEQIRKITHDPENVDLHPIAEAYLMAASRAQHVEETIYPALKAGHIVVCDRFVDSSIAYQGYGRKLGADVIGKLNQPAVNGAKPDVTLLLEVPPDVGLARRNGGTKKLDRLDLQQEDFYARVADGYRKLAAADPERYAVIDATPSIEQVAEIIWQNISGRLKNMPR